MIIFFFSGYTLCLKKPNQAKFILFLLQRILINAFFFFFFFLLYDDTRLSHFYTNCICCPRVFASCLPEQLLAAEAKHFLRSWRDHVHASDTVITSRFRKTSDSHHAPMPGLLLLNPQRPDKTTEQNTIIK
jgi:hypothetical protein